MKTVIALAILAQIAFTFSLQQGYNRYNQFRSQKLKFRAIAPFGFQMSIPSLTGRETVNFDVEIDQRIPGQAPKKVSYPGQAGWNRRWSAVDYNVQLSGGDAVYVTVTVNSDGQESKFEYSIFVREVFSEEEEEEDTYEARPLRIVQVAPQASPQPNKLS